MKTTINHSGMHGKLCLLALCLVAPSLAQAHPLPGQSSSLLGGLAHPLSGLDHILAMVAVGLWAAQLGGRSVWLVPAAFVGCMSIGGGLAISGFSLPMVETGIAVSVLVLGILIAITARLPLAASMALVGLFAVFHGHAHGTEMPASVSGLSYGLGFVLATAGLHACGISIGRLAQQQSTTPLLRFAGAAIALVGLFLCLA